MKKIFIRLQDFYFKSHWGLRAKFVVNIYLTQQEHPAKFKLLICSKSGGNGDESSQCFKCQYRASNVYLSGFNLLFSFEQTQKISCSGVHNWRMSDKYYININLRPRIRDYIFNKQHIYVDLGGSKNIAVFSSKMSGSPARALLKVQSSPLRTTLRTI